MKLYHLPFRGFLIFLPAVLLFACNPSSDEQKGENDLTLTAANVKLELVREWSLHDAEIFPNLTYFQTIGDGELIAGDYSLQKIYHIDENGEILRTMSGQGRGPGEMSSFFAMDTHPNGYIAAADLSSNRVTIFNLNDEQFRTTNFDAGWNPSLQWVDDKLMIVSNPFRVAARELPLGSLVINVYDPESDSSEEHFILELEMQNAPPEQLSCTFCPVVFMDEHHFFTINRDTTYRFHKFDVRTGEAETFEFSRFPPAIRFTESEREIIRENREESSRRTGTPVSTAPIPTHKFRFISLFIDANNRVWLEINPHQDSSRRFDIFSEDGSYLGSLDFPENAEGAEHLSESGILFRFPSEDPEGYSLKLYSLEW
ncbi:MAG: hypothetical protein LAT67_10600 [Balneolales bacterium]|nr:hypothetical protein [Balneolales bacterium]